MARHLIPGDTALRGIKQDDPRRRISDGAGLYLRLFVNGGSHGWRLDYSIAGVRKTLSLGTYPDTSLALARKKADDARKLVTDGVDPSTVRQAAKDRAKLVRDAQRRDDKGLPPAGSFEAVAREWIAQVHTSKVSEMHAKRTLTRFEQDVFPWLGRRPLAEIGPPELLACVRRIVDRGAVETAHRAKDACGQVFRYGMAAGLCARDPAADLRDALPPVQPVHHAAIVDPAELATLLRLVDEYSGQPVTRAAVKLSALLFLRPGELRQLEWAWVDDEAAMLTLPSALMKRRKAEKAGGAPHLVPLAPQALQVLADLRTLTGQGRYLFPALHTSLRPMSENTINTALRRMGYSNEQMTAHGFRATARTLAAERLGVAPEVIEAQLAHTVGDALGRAYNRAQYMDQRRALMSAWADYLDRLRKGAEVIALPPRAG